MALHHYRDIIDKCGPPLWWDECGVPRYCEFGPNEGNDIYAEQIALVRIRCQDCGTEFDVAMSYNLMDKVRFGMEYPTLEDQIKDGSIHYGDPPNNNCCAAGYTMNSEPVKVLQFWDRGMDEKRRPELEIVLDDDE